MTQPKSDLAYLRSEKAKAEQQLRYYKHREKILEHQIPELTRKARVHRLCTRAGMLESFLIAPEDLTNDQVMELLKIAFRQPEVALALAKMIHDLHESRSVPHPLECFYLLWIKWRHSEGYRVPFSCFHTNRHPRFIIHHLIHSTDK